MPILRTFPAEWTTIGGSELIINSIRERIGDKPELQRYFLPANCENMSKYIMDDNITFYDNRYKFWPYHLSISGATVASGVDVLHYKYMYFGDISDGNITDDPLDFWVESFYLSDFDIWNAYLSVDLDSYVRDSGCITEEMMVLKAALDLLPALRVSRKEQDYTRKRVRDNDTEYEKYMNTGVDPLKDTLATLQAEFDRLINNCNKNLYWDGYRVE
jgi:hypothetical protein